MLSESQNKFSEFQEKSPDINHNPEVQNKSIQLSLMQNQMSKMRQSRNIDSNQSLLIQNVSREETSSKNAEIPKLPDNLIVNVQKNQLKPFYQVRGISKKKTVVKDTLTLSKVDLSNNHDTSALSLSK